jgi:hypothetical protein
VLRESVRFVKGFYASSADHLHTAHLNWKLEQFTPIQIRGQVVGAVIVDVGGQLIDTKWLSVIALNACSGSTVGSRFTRRAGWHHFEKPAP